MDKDHAEVSATITSIDGTRTITVKEFDRLFDEASDEIDQFIDWASARRVGDAVEYRIGRPSDEATGQPPAPRTAAE